MNQLLKQGREDIYLTSRPFSGINSMKQGKEEERICRRIDNIILLLHPRIPVTCLYTETISEKKYNYHKNFMLCTIT